MTMVQTRKVLKTQVKPRPGFLLKFQNTADKPTGKEIQERNVFSHSSQTKYTESTCIVYTITHGWILLNMNDDWGCRPLINLPHGTARGLRYATHYTEDGERVLPDVKDTIEDAMDGRHLTLCHSTQSSLAAQNCVRCKDTYDYIPSRIHEFYHMLSIWQMICQAVAVASATTLTCSWRSTAAGNADCLSLPAFNAVLINAPAAPTPWLG